MEQNQFLSQQFMLFINDNYKQIKTSFKKDKYLRYTYTDDYFQDSIIKCAEMIHKKGISFTSPELSGKTFKNYLFISLKNIIQNENVKNKRLEKDENYIEEVDFEHLEIYNQNDELENEISRIKEDELIQEIFDYVDANYKHIYAGFFKFYFKTEYSYREIALLTGYSIATVFHHIDAIKKDVQVNFSNHKLPHRIIIKDTIQN